MPSRRAPSVTSSAVKPCTWMSRRDLLHRSRDGQVVVAVEVGVDPALQAHLGGAAVDRLDDAPLHLLELEQVRVAAEVERERTLRERAEPALERADVRVVDVAVADERDDVADDLGAAAGRPPRRPWRPRDPRASSSVTSSSTPGSSPASTPVEHLADRTPGARRWSAVAPATGRADRCRRRGPQVVAGQPLDVGRARAPRSAPRVQPRLGVAHVLRVHGEPRREHLAGRLGRVRGAGRARATAAPGSRGRA